MNTILKVNTSQDLKKQIPQLDCNAEIFNLLKKDIIDFFNQNVYEEDWDIRYIKTDKSVFVEWNKILKLWEIIKLPSWEKVIKVKINCKNIKFDEVFLKNDFSILRDQDWKIILTLWKIIEKWRWKWKERKIKKYTWVFIEHWLGAIPVFLLENWNTRKVWNVTRNPFEWN